MGGRVTITKQNMRKYKYAYDKCDRKGGREKERERSRAREVAIYKDSLFIYAASYVEAYIWAPPGSQLLE